MIQGVPGKRAKVEEREERLGEEKMEWILTRVSMQLLDCVHQLVSVSPLFSRLWQRPPLTTNIQSTNSTFDSPPGSVWADLVLSPLYSLTMVLYLSEDCYVVHSLTTALA